MAMPTISVTFTSAAQTAVARSERGFVGLIVSDDGADPGAHILRRPADIPAGLDPANRDYIDRAFIGYVNPPKLVTIFVMPTEQTSYVPALDYFSTQNIDWLCGAPDISMLQAQEIVLWVKARREDKQLVKAVLPNVDADDEAIINFTALDIQVKTVSDIVTYSAAEYCSRIAGLLAGTPLRRSCTYAHLPEVLDVKRYTRSQLDNMVDAGQLVLFNDGKKVLVGRGVNSLTTVTEFKQKEWKKIKIVDAIDFMTNDIRTFCQDIYIGKYPNSYDSKCLLISAVTNYFAGLENLEVLSRGRTTVGIDIEAQEAYLSAQGIDTSELTADEIKQADTDSSVFILASLGVLDAIEDITINITI